MDFLQEFCPNKKYVFDKDIYIEYMISVNEYTEENILQEIWTNNCNNKAIEILNKTTGIINVKGVEYEVTPEWCREVPSIRLLTENDL